MFPGIMFGMPAGKFPPAPPGREISPGSPAFPNIAPSAPKPLPLDIALLISAICLWSFKSLLSSVTSKPAPSAILLRRLACRIFGLDRSFLVIELISAICLPTILSSMPEASAFAASFFIPGIIDITELIPPIFCIASSCWRMSFMLNKPF